MSRTEKLIVELCLKWNLPPPVEGERHWQSKLEELLLHLDRQADKTIANRITEE